MDIVLNVQGQIFKTNYDTIIKIPYFRDMFDGCGKPEGIIELDRPAHIFKHILGLLSSPFYKFPEKYKHELDFYGIFGRIVYHNNQEIMDKMNLLENKINDLENKINDLENKCVCGKVNCQFHSKCEDADCFEIVNSFEGYKLKWCKDHAEQYKNWEHYTCGAKGCGTVTNFNTIFCFDHKKLKKSYR